jgi:O-antigen/teichoic acid export membrane protein
VLALLGPLLISIVFGPAFSASYAPLLALLPGIVLLGGGKVLTSELAGRGYAHYNSINAGMALVLTVVLDLALIPRLGVTGAAIASTVAYSVIFVTAVFFYLLVSRRSRTAASDGAEGSPESGDIT